MSSLQAKADTAYGRYCSARGEMLAAVAELAASDEWRGHGVSQLASRLAARWQISLPTARELVRDAEALAERPALSAALVEGSVSVDQCKALAKLCRPDSDDAEVWLEALPTWSFAELQREARRAVAKELERRDDGVYLRMGHTPDERYVRGEFQLHPEDGEVLMRAIDARVPDGTRLRDWDSVSARALVELASAGVTSARATVMVSVTADELAAASGTAAVGDGFVGAATARRLACDGRLQPFVTDEAGRLIQTAPASRTIPAPVRRAVEVRDGGRCTFPGCERDKYLDCHHLIHFADGGPSLVWNLQLVCWEHHKLVHEGGWSIRGEAGPGAEWVRPDGTPFEPRVRVTLDTS